jgi:hypothetical protein
MRQTPLMYKGGECFLKTRGGGSVILEDLKGG